MKKIFLICIALIAISTTVFAHKDSELKLQSDSTVPYALIVNTVSNIDFYVSNYGINFFDVYRAKGGLFWPRGTKNQYVFGDGFWFGAKKYNSELNELSKLVLVTYNPTYGSSWTSPGRIEDGNEAQYGYKNKYHPYLSTEYNTYTGAALDTDNEYKWPLWISNGQMENSHSVYNHEYVLENNDRNRNKYSNGPLFVSDEDILSTYKDTDISRYDGNADNRLEQGYPLKLQTESSIYSWGEGEMQDVLILRYVIENKSLDTLFDCRFGKITDLDIGVQADSNQSKFALNDRVKYYDSDSTLNLVVGWTDTDQGELGKGFGYIGISLLETPSIDKNGFIRNDKLKFEPEEMVGINTFKNWNFESDPLKDNDRYDFLSNGILDGDSGSGDKRVLISTGSFNMKPGDKAHISVIIAFAMPANGVEADGSKLDIAGLPIGIANDEENLKGNNKSLIGKISYARDRYFSELITKIVESEKIKKDGLYVHPNPTYGFIAIKPYINSDNFNASKIQIFDIIGIEVMNVVASNNLTTQIIDISHLPSGVYFIRIGDKVEKFVKN